MVPALLLTLVPAHHPGLVRHVPHVSLSYRSDVNVHILMYLFQLSALRLVKIVLPVLLRTPVLVHQDGPAQHVLPVSVKNHGFTVCLSIDFVFQPYALQHVPMVVHVLLRILAVVQPTGVEQYVQHVR